jgi:DNA-binding MarR family transcriptional regulator
MAKHDNRSDLVFSVHTAMRGLAHRMLLYSHAAAARLGLHPTDLTCLDLLLSRGPMTPGQLAAETGLTPGAITAAVDRLERKGHATRARDPHDRRRVLVAAQDSANQTAPVFEAMIAAASRLCAGYSDRDLRRIIRFTEQAGAMLHQQARELGTHQPASSNIPRRQAGQP